MNQPTAVHSAPTARVGRKLDCIQVFRGIAALLVALHHAAAQVAGSEFVKNGSREFFVGRYVNTDLGMIGVDLFFVVSGFIMVFTTAKRGMKPVDFLKRRGIRIYPLYWFFSLVVVGIHLTPYLGRIEGNPAIFIKSFALYPVFLYNGDILRPAFLPQGWTLTYEILFYLVFAATMRLRSLVQFAVITVGFTAACLIANQFAGLRSAELALLSDPILLEFPLGMLLGILYCHRGPFLSPAVSWILCGVALVAIPLLWSAAAPRLVSLGLPAFLLISALVLGRQTESLRFPRWLVFMGDASYSLYLTHVIVQILFQVGYVRLPILQNLPGDIYYAVLLLAMVAVGALSYLWVERPLLALGRRLT